VPRVLPDRGKWRGSCLSQLTLQRCSSLYTYFFLFNADLSSFTAGNDDPLALLHHRRDPSSVLSDRIVIRHRQSKAIRPRTCVGASVCAMWCSGESSKADVLVAPVRPVLRFQDLAPHELTSLMTSVQSVGRVIERAYQADGLSIVCQAFTLFSQPNQLNADKIPFSRMARQLVRQSLMFTFIFYPGDS